MMEKQECEVVRDLLPLVVEGLASEPSRRMVEQHLATCPECAALRHTMQEMIAPVQPQAEEKQVDYLKTVRRKSRRRVILAVAATLLVLVLGAAAKLFLIGDKAKDTVGLSWWQQTSEDGAMVTVRVSSAYSADAFAGWNMKRQGDAVYLEGRRVLVSPLYPTAFYMCEIAVADVREIYLCGKLIWQDGVPIFGDTATLFPLKTPYLGSASAVAAITNALQVGVLDGAGYDCTLSLSEDGVTIHVSENLNPGFAVETVPGALLGDRSAQLLPKAVKMLALIDNLQQVHWTFGKPSGSTDYDGGITLAEAEELVAALWNGARKAGVTALEYPGLKNMDTPAKYQTLVNVLSWGLAK